MDPDQTLPTHAHAQKCALKKYCLAEPWTDREVMYVRYIGELFLRMLKALILPLIIPSLISAIGSLDMSLSGKVGGRAVGYYMATTVFAVILGIILVNAIHPGRAGTTDDDSPQRVSYKQHKTKQPSFIMVNFINISLRLAWRVSQCHRS